MKNGKTGGVNEITAEILKAVADATARCLETIFLTNWNQETTPSFWNKGLIVRIPKKSVPCRSARDNYRDIMSLPSKVFSTILLQGIQISS